MSAESEFYDAATTAAGVIALVGTKVYPDVAPEGKAVPLIVYERRSSEPITTIHDGAPVASRVIVSASGWAHSRADAEALGDAIELAMHDTAVSTGRFGHYDAQTALYAAVIDFEVWEL